MWLLLAVALYSLYIQVLTVLDFFFIKFGEKGKEGVKI
jgi:hypothetical protein